MQNLVYHVAMSLDGYIAGPGGSIENFSSEGTHVEDYLAAIPSYSIALMGRRTYQLGLDTNVTDPYPGLETYVVSRTLSHSPAENVTIISADLEKKVRALKEQAGRGIYLVGGGSIATQLLDAGLIDALILKLNPILLGGGIPLFEPGHRFQDFSLKNSKTYENGVVLLHYTRY